MWDGRHAYETRATRAVPSLWFASSATMVKAVIGAPEAAHRSSCVGEWLTAGGQEHGVSRMRQHVRVDTPPPRGRVDGPRLSKKLARGRLEDCARKNILELRRIPRSVHF